MTTYVISSDESPDMGVFAEEFGAIFHECLPLAGPPRMRFAVTPAAEGVSPVRWNFDRMDEELAYVLTDFQGSSEPLGSIFWFDPVRRHPSLADTQQSLLEASELIPSINIEPARTAEGRLWAFVAAIAFARACKAGTFYDDSSGTIWDRARARARLATLANCSSFVEAAERFVEDSEGS